MLLEALLGMPVRQGVTIRIIFKTNLTHITPISAKMQFFLGGGRGRREIVYKKKVFYCYVQFKTKQKIIQLYKDGTVTFILLKRNSGFVLPHKNCKQIVSTLLNRKSTRKITYCFMQIP
jgi:hypothetical protein